MASQNIVAEHAVRRILCPHHQYLKQLLPRPSPSSTLHFIDFCGDVLGRGMDEKSMEWKSVARGYLRWTKGTHLCGAHVSKSLADVLLQMPHLRTLTFRFPSLTYAHGLPWSVTRQVLSLPHLQELSLDMFRIAPKLSAGEEHILNFPTSLTSFSYKLSDYHERSEVFPTERRALELVLDSSSSTLQRLTPLNLLRDPTKWSNLRELCLRGQYPTIDDPPLPLVVVFAHMTNLRVLELKFMQPRNLELRPICLSEHAGVWPWSYLEGLIVSCPQVDDNIYDALSKTLYSLSLPRTPHYLNHIWKKKRGLPLYADWPLVSSTGLLHILRRCEVPRLRHLGLEYTADDGETDLLRYVTMVFPDLSSLQAADVLARALGPRMKEMRLWKSDLTAVFTWLAYSTLRGDDAPRVRLDRILPTNHAGY